MNTSEGTVKGQLEGPQNELNEMLSFLLFTEVFVNSIKFSFFHF